MHLDTLAEDCERRVSDELAKIYRPSADDVTRAWKTAIIDVIGAALKRK